LPLNRNEKIVFRKRKVKNGVKEKREKVKDKRGTVEDEE
jgi:hypothetical protein